MGRKSLTKWLVSMIDALLIVFTAADNVRCPEWSAVGAFFIARLPLKTGWSFASLSSFVSVSGSD
jgi:hypothetical protein